MNAFRLAVLAFVLAFSLPVFAQEQTPQQRYDELVTRLMGGDTDVDYRALRYAYNESPQFSPFGASNRKKEMFLALNAEEFDQALSIATEILKGDYTDIDAHFASYVSFDRRHDGTMALFHRAVIRGLVESIEESGDGKTPETAYVVVRVPEEYSFLGLNGWSVEMQTLLQSTAGPVDAMAVENAMTHEKQTIYFNVSRPFAAYQRLFGGNQPGDPAPTTP